MKLYPQWLSIGPRGCGRTTVLIEAAKKIGATFVCGHKQQADDVKREHGIETICISANPMGTKGPYIFDHNAMLQIVLDYDRKLDESVTKLERRTEALERVFSASLMPRDWEGYAVKIRGIAREALSE